MAQTLAGFVGLFILLHLVMTMNLVGNRTANAADTRADNGSYGTADNRTGSRSTGSAAADEFRFGVVFGVFCMRLCDGIFMRFLREGRGQAQSGGSYGNNCELCELHGDRLQYSLWVFGCAGTRT